jgi:hypothetical protein
MLAKIVRINDGVIPDNEETMMRLQRRIIVITVFFCDRHVRFRVDASLNK